MFYLDKWSQARGEWAELPVAYNRNLQPAPTLRSEKLMLPVRCPWGFNIKSHPSVIEEHISETKVSIIGVSDSRFTEGPFSKARWNYKMRGSLCTEMLALGKLFTVFPAVLMFSFKVTVPWGIWRKVCGSFHLCFNSQGEWTWGCLRECREKELERTEAGGSFECLIKVLAVDSKHGALGIQPGPAPTDLLIQLIPGDPAQVTTGVDLISEATCWSLRTKNGIKDIEWSSKDRDRFIEKKTLLQMGVD